MAGPRIVLDSCVLASALRSQRGASHRLLLLIDSGKFEICLSVPLFLEYEAACKRFLGAIPLTEQDLDDILDYLCQVAHQQKVFYLWRAFLPDAGDDMVLELASAAGCVCIVTFNARDFRGAEQFGVRVLSPQQFLREIGELP
jgi:predicted nucleic acid-binding protein